MDKNGLKMQDVTRDPAFTFLETNSSFVSCNNQSLDGHRGKRPFSSDINQVDGRVKSRKRYSGIQKSAFRKQVFSLSLLVHLTILVWFLFES